MDAGLCEKAGEEVQRRSREQVWHPSKPDTNKQALIDEAIEIKDTGGLDPIKLHNKRNSAGKKWIE